MEHAWESAFESSEALRNSIISEAEALYRQTGLTPAQLQARVAELEGALRTVLGDHEQGIHWGAPWVEVRRVLGEISA